MTPENPQMFREGLKARVLSTIADHVAAKKRHKDAVQAEKVVCAQYAAELHAFKQVGELKCDIASQTRRGAFDASGRAATARTTALSNLEHNLRSPGTGI